jgi:class 3 adenylate cyclase
VENPSPGTDKVNENDPGQLELDRDQLIQKLKAAEKELSLLKFKIDRLEVSRQTLTVMLEESVQELETKSDLLAQSNKELEKSLQQLKERTALIEAQKQELETEKSRSEKLLLDILPHEVVNELKLYGRSYARKYDNATVLLADIKEFSSIAENLQPNELVVHLDDYFRGFDYIMEKYGIEKIKTIGDAYMCASGLFKETPDHALNMIKAAMDMVEFSKSFGISKKIQNLPCFEFRIGIHSGPVIAGVIGVKKFAYDVWGDTVNVAARMEQNGEPNRVNISASTFNLVKDHYNCTNRGTITVKNGRNLEMYFVESLIA